MTDRPATARHNVWIQRGVVAAVWLIAIVMWRRYQTSNVLSAAEAAQRFIDNVDTAWWGIAAYVGVYLLRPIVLFPASILTVVGGVLFGPVAGVIVVVVAANTSAMIAYGIGRTLGRPPGSHREPADLDEHRADSDESPISFAARWADRMRATVSKPCW